MQIFLGADHGGYELKDQIAAYLKSSGHTVTNLGTNNSNSVDYPEYGHLVAKSVVANQGSLGIVVCGSGIGISIAANKVEGIRAALCHCVEYAKLAKQHNNANVLALGGRFLTKEEAIEIVDTFLTTAFEGGRHQLRIDKIEC